MISRLSKHLVNNLSVIDLTLVIKGYWLDLLLLLVILRTFTLPMLVIMLYSICSRFHIYTVILNSETFISVPVIIKSSNTFMYA